MWRPSRPRAEHARSYRQSYRVDDRETTSGVSASKQIIGANADAARKSLEVIDRIWLPDVEETEQREAGSDQQPRRRKRNEKENYELTHDFVDDRFGRVGVAEQLDRSASRPDPKKDKEKKCDEDESMERRDYSLRRFRMR